MKNQVGSHIRKARALVTQLEAQTQNIRLGMDELEKVPYKGFKQGCEGVMMETLNVRETCYYLYKKLKSIKE